MANEQWNLVQPQTLCGGVFVTFRTAGSVPAATINRLEAEQHRWLTQITERGINARQWLSSASKRFLGRLDDLLDAPGQSDLLIRPGVADVIRTSLLRYNDVYYRLGAYCIMPSHVHALLFLPEPFAIEANLAVGEQAVAPEPLDRFLAFWTLGTTHRINSLLRRSGPLWHPAFYIQPIQDTEELNRLADYIAFNPLKAGLVARPHEWQWSSAHDRFERDGCESAWLCSEPATGPQISFR
ncbi:MAG: hypothetical protein U0840_14900 [Gemmataceae bacterium]